LAAAALNGEVTTMSKLTSHAHECPRCHTTWECGEANYQDECPYPLQTPCLKCWADPERSSAPAKPAAKWKGSKARR
jgi:hypothetical protein